MASSDLDTEKILTSLTPFITDIFKTPADQVNLELNFYEDLQADSVDVIELISCAESTYDIEVSDDEIQEIYNVETLIKVIQRRAQADKENSAEADSENS